MSLLGKKIGDYLFEEEIGRGSFGTVYKVSKTDAGGKYTFAIKHMVMPTEQEYNEMLLQMNNNVQYTDEHFKHKLQEIIAEFDNMLNLSSKNSRYFVTYYDHTVSGTPKQYDIFIRMELMTSLNECVKRKAITVLDVLNIGIDIAEALSICHSKRIIHRDIKDANVFVNEDGDYKLGDFGVAKRVDTTTQLMSRKGTPFYMAPEMLLNKHYSYDVDIYALCMMLYKLLNFNRFPFLPRFPQFYSASDMDAAQTRKLTSEPPLLPQNAENALGELVIRGLLAPDERLKTAQELIKGLKELKAALPSGELERVVSMPIEAHNTLNEAKTQQSTVGFTQTGTNSFSRENEPPPELIFEEKKREPAPITPAEEDLVVVRAKKMSPFLFVVPLLCTVCFALMLDVQLRDILLFGGDFINSTPFRVACLVLLGLIALFFVVLIIIYPDKGTLYYMARSMVWKQKSVEIIDDIDKWFNEKTENDEQKKSYKLLRKALMSIRGNITGTKGYWRMTSDACGCEDVAYNELAALKQYLMETDYVRTLSALTATKTMGDRQKSEVELMCKKIEQYVALRAHRLA